jgi:hypothetical protein
MTKKTNKHRLLHKLFNAISNSIDDIGYANTIQVLNNSRSRSGENYERFNDCVKAVMQVFQITKSELLQGTQKKYPRKYAFSILIHLCVVECNYTCAAIGRLLNKDRSNLSRIKNDMDKKLMRNDNSKFDAMILNKYQSCKQILIKSQELTEIND